MLSLALLLRLAAGPVPQAPGTPWVLSGTGGQRVSDADFRGRYVLLYFGYTRCPDVCPTTLAAVSEAMHELGARARRVQPLFVTIDPGHDTPADIRAYVGRFGGGLIGLTGTERQIGAMERDYWVHVARHPGPPARIDHSAVLYLIGPDGGLLAPIAADADAGAIARILRRRLDSLS